MNEKINRTLLWGSYYAYIVTGILVLMTGAILPYLIKNFNLSYSQSGLLLSLQAAGCLCAGFISGVSSVNWDRKYIMLSGAACFIVGFGGVLITPSPILLFIFIFISGLGWGTMNTMVNSIVNDVAGGQGSALNLLHMFFSIGGFIGPFIVSISVKLNLNWRYDVLLAIILSAILFHIFFITPAKLPEKQTKNSKSSLEILSDFRLYIFMGILFFDVGTENTINGWIVTYLINSHIMNEFGAQSILSMMFASMIIGRLACSFISRKLSKERILLGCSIAVAFFFIILLTLKNPLMITICILGVALSISGVYPTTVANAGYIIKRSGTMGGIMLSCGGLGASIVPYVAGGAAQRYGIHAVMLTVAFSMAALVVFILFNSIAKKVKAELIMKKQISL